MSLLFDLQRQDGSSSADRAIGTYLLDHMDELANLSIGDLATQTHTSNASVIRLCRKLGSSGYRELKLGLLREAERIPTHEPTIDVSYPFRDRSSPAAVVKNMADVHRYAIAASYQSVNALDIQKAANMIRKARRILLYGKGESDLTLRIFSRRLMRIGYPSIIANDHDETLAATRFAGEEDVALFVSYSGSGLYLYNLDRKYLAYRKSATILISANDQLTGFTHRILYPKAEIPEENAATFYSTEASLFILDSIYGVLFSMEYNRARKEKQALDTFMRRHMSGGMG